MTGEKKGDDRVNLKTCSRCRKEFPATPDYYYRDSTAGDSLQSYCKVCAAEYGRAYRELHKEELAKKAGSKRKPKIPPSPADLERKREERRNKKRQYHITHREELRESNREYYYSHREQCIAAVQSWKERNRERVNEYRRQLYRSNPTFRISRRICAGISQSLRGKAKSKRSWEELVGYSAVELKVHLQSQFLDGMNWDNMNEWHIDHIRPISSFKFASPDDPEFKECWALSNLRPLWAKDNMHKHKKWSPPTMPR